MARMIFLLRHADRQSPADALSPAGLKRANFLAHMLAESGVRTAYCSDAQRTHETLAPLKQRLGEQLAITEFSAAGPGGIDGHIQSVISAVRALPDSAIAVVVSHSNTIAPIVDGLDGGSIPTIGDEEFDRIFLLTMPPEGSNALLQLRY